MAKDIDITFRTVWNHTRDIRAQKVIPKKLKDKIREEIKNGKSKYQTAKEYNLPTTTVFKIAKDLLSAPSGWPEVREKILDLLQEIVSEGICFFFVWICPATICDVVQVFSHDFWGNNL